MWFHFFTGNHDKTGRASLYDMMEWLTAGLTELKHDVTVGTTIAPHAINIIWENFRHKDEEIFETHDFKFGLIATEIPVGRTFNWLDDGSWPTRRQTFDKIAGRAQFIWSMVEEPVGDYQRWAPSGYLELGFSEQIVDPIFAQEPQVDFGFYGLSITPYRNAVLEHLRKYCTIATPNRFLKGHDLNSFIASFKVGICLKHSPQWTIPSPARTARLLHAKRGIAAEYVPVQTRASVFTTMANKNQDFAEFCLECLRGPWQQRAEEAYERFRAAMPMKQIMERLLDTTVAKSPTLLGSTVLSADDGLRNRVRFQASYQPMLIDTRGDYNFVKYARRIHALRRDIGEVDLTVEDEQALVRGYGANAVIIAGTIDEARAKTEALSNQPLKGRGLSKSARRKRAPELVCDHLGFNIVRVTDGYLALRKSLGEVVIDRSAEDIVRDKGFANAAFAKSMGDIVMHIHLVTILQETADAKTAARNLAGVVEQLDARVRDQIEALHGALNEIRSSIGGAIDKINRDLRDLPQLLEEGYKGHNLVQFRSRFWGLPQALGPMNPNLEADHRRGGVLQAESLTALKALIDTENSVGSELNEVSAEAATFQHRLLEEGYKGHNLVQFGGRFWGLPQALGPMSLNLEADRRRGGVLKAESLAELRDLIDNSTKGIGAR